MRLNFFIQKKWFRRLFKTTRAWHQDESGLVLAFTAIVLPFVLFIGVMIVQSGQLYVRQSQIQFMARQAANSSLVLVSERLKNAAEQNYQNTCNVELPPSSCDSNNWSDFLNVSQARSVAASSSSVAAVEEEAQNFAINTDPKNLITQNVVSVVFPFETGNQSELVAQVFIEEPQTSWIGNILRPEAYTLKVEARSYLNLNES